MNVRSARIEDAAAIATIHVRGWQVAYAGILPSDYLEALSIEKRTARWLNILQQPRGGTLVSLENELVVGWIDHGPARDPDREGESEVYAIYVRPERWGCVRPERWGCGVGTQLIRRAEHDILARGSARVSLCVLQQNAPARRFYEREGWFEDGACKSIEIGGVSLAEVRYEKRRPNSAR